MKNLTQLLIFGCLFVTSNIFSQNTSVDSVNKNSTRAVKRTVTSVKVVTEGKVNLPYVDTLPLEPVIKKDQVSSINNEASDAEYEYEYDYGFQATKNQLSSSPVESKVEYEAEYEYESEYEYETVDNQISSVSGNSYEEYEYEYDTPKNQLSNFSDDPEAEYEYE